MPQPERSSTLCERSEPERSRGGQKVLDRSAGGGAKLSEQMATGAVGPNSTGCNACVDNDCHRELERALPIAAVAIGRTTRLNSGATDLHRAMVPLHQRCPQLVQACLCRPPNGPAYYSRPARG